MTVLLAVRIGEGSRAAASAAQRLASRLEATLRFVYVARELDAVPELAAAAAQSEEDVRARMTEEILERCRAELAIQVTADELMIRQGSVPDAVARAAADLRADLIVVGMKGRSALAKLVLGDTTGAILERAPCPVVVIPPAIASTA